MSKKQILPIAVAAASVVTIDGAQSALYVNEQGTGETLIYPFYSAQNGNNTLINVANASSGHKAVKIRILEAQNSQEVLDFNLYLSPEDHFSFSISATEDGGAKMVTGDNSCSVPAIPPGGAEFSTLKIGGSLERTQVGYVEIIEMGQLDADSAPVIDTKGLADASRAAINAAAAITHGGDGVPANCSILVDAWSRYSGVDGIWLAESKTTNLTGESEFLANWEGGGLYGYATVINVPEGTSFGYDALAIADHVAMGATGSAMHYEPGDIRPSLGDTALDTAAIIRVGGAAVSMDFDGDYALEATERIQALNATIMATEIYNDYVTDPDIAASTDWIMTFPTKIFHVNAGTPIEPFSKLSNGQSACEPSKIGAVNREEGESAGFDSSSPIFSPAPPDPSNDLLLCYESTVVQFAEKSALNAENIVVGVNGLLDDDDGWATITFDPSFLDGVLGTCEGATIKTPCTREIDAGDGSLLGLPVVGFAVQKYVNGNVDGTGVLANYSMASEHRSCVAGSGTTANTC